jgi:hypothetical protein
VNLAAEDWRSLGGSRTLSSPWEGYILGRQRGPDVSGQRTRPVAITPPRHLASGPQDA